MEYNLCGSSWRLHFVKCERVCLCRVCVSMCTDQEHNKTSHDAFAKSSRTVSSQTDKWSYTQTDTPRQPHFVEPTRYDLHLRDDTEIRRRTRVKKKRAGQRGNEEDRRGSCLFALNCLVSPVCWTLTGCACCLDPSACSPVAKGGGSTRQVWGRGQGQGMGGS